jgi:hypothetical protein
MMAEADISHYRELEKIGVGGLGLLAILHCPDNLKLFV